MAANAQSKPRMQSLVLEVEPTNIAMLKAVVESYDNLVTLRTEDPIRHRLRMWFDPALAADVEALLDSLRQSFPVRVLSRA